MLCCRGASLPALCIGGTCQVCSVCRVQPHADAIVRATCEHRGELQCSFVVPVCLLWRVVRCVYDAESGERDARLDIRSAAKAVGLCSVSLCFVSWVVSFVPDLGLPVDEDVYVDYLEYYCPWVCFVKFYAGILVGRIYVRVGNIPTISRRCTMTLVLLLLCYPLVPYMGVALDAYFILLVGCVLLVSVDVGTAVARVLSARCLVWLGDISSEIFLMHLVVSLYVNDYLMQSGIISMPWCFPVTIVFTLLLSTGWRRFR